MNPVLGNRPSGKRETGTRNWELFKLIKQSAELLANLNGLILAISDGLKRLFLTDSNSAYNFQKWSGTVSTAGASDYCGASEPPNPAQRARLYDDESHT